MFRRREIWEFKIESNGKMSDIIQGIRDRITEFQRNYAKTAEQLAKPVQFLQSSDENILNAQIHSIFANAADILQPISTAQTQQIETGDIPTEAITEYTKRLELMEAALERRSRGFSSAITTAKHMLYEMFLNLKEQNRVSLEELHTTQLREMRRIEDDLRETKLGFDDRLREEISAKQTEHSKITSKFNKQKDENERMKTTLSASLEASKTREQLLSKQKRLLTSANSNVTESINGKFEQQIKANEELHKERKEALLAELERIKASHREYLEEMNEELSKAAQVIESAGGTDSDELDRELLIKQNLHKKALKKLAQTHINALKELSHQQEVNEIAHKGKVGLMEAEIKRLTTVFEERKQKITETLDLIETRSKQIVDEKDNEIKLITKVHQRTLKQQHQKHELEMEQINHSFLATRQALEQKLHQTNRDAETSRRRLQSEVTALTRAKDRLEEEISKTNKAPRVVTKATPMNLSIPQTLCDIPPPPPPEKTQFDDEIDSRKQKFNTAAEKESNALFKVISLSEESFKAQQERLQLRKDEIRRFAEYLEKQKGEFNKEIQHLKAVLLNLESNKQMAIRAEEDSINKQIAEQHTKTMKLKDAIGVYRDQGTKASLETLIAENEKDIEEIQQRIDARKAETQMKIDKIRAETTEGFREEETVSQEILAGLAKRIADARKDIEETRQSLTLEPEKHKEWVNMRKEMADSNNRVFGILNNQAGAMGQFSSSKLPPLDPLH